MVGPLSAVLGQFAGGATTLAEVSRATGLSRDVVDASVAHLVRLGRLDAKELALGCPSGGCGTCASAVDAAPGCGASAPSRQRSGPVLVALTLPGRHAHAGDRTPASASKPTRHAVESAGGPEH